MPEMEPFVKHAEKSVETDRENLFNDDSKADDANRSVKNFAGGSRHSDDAFSDGSMVVLRGRHYEEVESSGIVYVPRWVLPNKSRVDTPEQCVGATLIRISFMF
ncbi:hypothetical protein Tco_0818763 [Tanacetum coccineum]